MEQEIPYMNRVYSNLNATSKIAKRLVQRNADVVTAEIKRDICLYKFLQKIHKLSEMLRKMNRGEVRRELKTRYSKVPNNSDPAVLAMKLTHPNLHPNVLWKYTSILRFFRGSKKPGQSLRRFVQGHGGINRCVTEEKRSRARQQIRVRKRRKH
jgi:hypothetical protein